MFHRILWALWGRYRMAKKCLGFSASKFSYVDKLSCFSDYNQLFGRTTIMNSTIGRYTYIAGAKVSKSIVGNFCSIGPEAIIGGLGRHPTNWLSSHPVFYSPLKQCGQTFSGGEYFEELPQVVLGHDVWVGARAIILGGVKVGSGAIIAAGAVVVDDVPPYAVVGGVPAKLIRMRFDENNIEYLLNMKWWNWDDQKLKKSAHLFRTENINFDALS
jgi:acetyltransferase-like isoleucine patch superfamily enzyme